MIKKNYELIFSLILIFQMFNLAFSIKEWWEETKIQILDDNNFYDVVGKDKYVVVKFFTKWCMYCKMMAPEYEKFYELYLKKRDDILIKKIECSDKKVCIDYGIFAFPFVGLFFPGSKKLKSVFKYRRSAEFFDKWITLVAPKKNLKSNKKIEKEEVDDSSAGGNMTEIEDYITKQFSSVKTDVKNVLKHIDEITDNGKKEINLGNTNEDSDDDDVIEIKITPFLIVKVILFFFLLKIVFYYIKNCLFVHHSLPTKIHQKN
jgi:thiol-disulfide isomerase/thioredoxin